MDIKERRFEEDIESYMLSEGGYTKGSDITFDREKGLDLTKLIKYIEATQPREWERYQKIYGSDSISKLYKRFDESVDMHGLLHVLRHGIEDRGIKLKLASFKPETSLNPAVIEKYNANIVECVRQFHYSTQNNNSIDMVLMLNGIPVVALELKNQLTGQSVENAKKQYMKDRDAKETCFGFNRRFLVYFAVDLFEVEMTTELKGKDTFFLPFNMGSNGAGNVGGAGNPVNEDGYTTSYLWEKVLQKDILLDILQRYMHLSVEEKIDTQTGKKKTSRKLIFPRYHQLDVVTKILADVKANGAGHNYLIQHSAGSGKSNSIAWLSYGLANLHDADDNKIFKSVIVVTDRTILDSQLQDTIYSFDHTEGVVEKIDEKKKSTDLRDAINAGKKIIITTLQKFPYIYQEVENNANKNFAVIIDEAHSSQSGSSAMKLKSALADTEESLREYAELEGKAESEIKDEEDKLVQEMLAHGRHSNLSFFAFTATPKEKTLEMFGTKQADGSFRAYHIYSMKQAIEEGFILDVLQNYMTYKTCYKIVKNMPDNPEVPATKATKAVLRFESLHPHNLQQKTAIIIETFRSVTKNKIGGRGKAMVVTASRLHAIRYYHEFKRYLERHHYDDLDILVAFSGAIKDIDATGEEVEYTEEKLNKRADGTHIKESQLKEEFHKDEYAMLIVAEKYQTGFDEPLLHTMFVDKKLKGVKAVQTLSRLNRTCAGKTDTFVLDFVNTADEIKEAFQPYYECTELDEEINPNLIYDTRKIIRDFGLYNDEDIATFLKLFFKKEKQTASDLGKLTSLFKPIINRYNELSEDKRFDYKKTVRNFVKWYSYITQISRMFDKGLHEEYTFCQYLAKLLPRATSKDVDLDDKLRLEFYKLEKEFKGSISLNPTQEDKTLVNVKKLKTGGTGKDQDVLLDQIITSINDKFSGVFTEADRVLVEIIYDKSVRMNKRLEVYAKKNDEAVFRQSIFPEVFKKVAQECYIESMDAFSKLFEDKVFYATVMDAISREAYKDLRNRK